jgi:hypothetical protein
MVGIQLWHTVLLDDLTVAYALVAGLAAAKLFLLVAPGIAI